MMFQLPQKFTQRFDEAANQSRQFSVIGIELCFPSMQKLHLLSTNTRRRLSDLFLFHTPSHHWMPRAIVDCCNDTVDEALAINRLAREGGEVTEG